ncbi:glyoxalase [Bacteroidia bacterium]|nr:glyoxalase [Bacteroidia bacterium]
MTRNKELLKLRPNIKTILRDLKTSPMEQFQNTTLRPILKFQHDILLALFHACLVKNRSAFTVLRAEEKEEKINQLFQKDLRFKNQSLGAVVGMLTAEEYAIYAEDTSSLDRRIVFMLKQRIMSTY